jgi:hypothetical protein
MHAPAHLRRLSGPVALVLALTLTVTASLLLGSQGTAAGASTAADRGAVAHTAQGTMTSKVTGRASDGSKVTGTFTPLKFMQRHGQEQVQGLVQGVVHHANGSRETFSALRTMTVKKINGQAIHGRSAAAGRAAACNILNLVLGPLDLNLLGLQVHLDRVVLNIVAVAGAGNLLGNLLCAVAGLLDNGPLAGLLAQLTNLLRQILGALNLGI